MNEAVLGVESVLIQTKNNPPKINTERNNSKSEPKSRSKTYDCSTGRAFLAAAEQAIPPP